MRSDQRGKSAQPLEIAAVRPERAPLHRITIWGALQVLRCAQRNTWLVRMVERRW